MAKISSTWKNCITCMFWQGERQASNPWRDYVEYPNNAKGECGAGIGKGFNGAKMQPLAHCKDFLKWGLLK